MSSARLSLALLVAFLSGGWLAEPSPAATRHCGDAWGGGLRFENIGSGGLSCRKARKFAAHATPNAYECTYAVKAGDTPADAVFRYHCWRTDRPRWFRFTLR